MGIGWISMVIMPQIPLLVAAVNITSVFVVTVKAWIKPF